MQMGQNPPKFYDIVSKQPLERKEFRNAIASKNPSIIMYFQFFPHDFAFDARLEPEYDIYDETEYLNYEDNNEDINNNSPNSGSFLDFSQPALSR